LYLVRTELRKREFPGNRARGGGIDPCARLEVEEMQAARVDHEPGLLPFTCRGAAFHAGDERAAVMASLLLGGLERLAADDLPQLVGLDRRCLDREVEEDLVAHVLLDVDRHLELPAGRRLAAAGVCQILRPDPEGDALPEVPAELRPPPREAVRARDLARPEHGDETAVPLDELRLD